MVDVPGLRTILQTRAQGTGAAIDVTTDGIAASGLIDNRLHN
jgi:hypothetical protein